MIDPISLGLAGHQWRDDDRLTRPFLQHPNQGEASKFPWTYGEAETCYILKGKVTVTPNGGKPVTVRLCVRGFCCVCMHAYMDGVDDVRV